MCEPFILLCVRVLVYGPCILLCVRVLVCESVVSLCVQDLNRIVSIPVVSPMQITYTAPQTVFQITQVFQKNFLTNTKVLNSLCCRNERDG